jgi:hypothetical protein
MANPGQEDVDGDGTSDVCETAAACGAMLRQLVRLDVVSLDPARRPNPVC